MAECPQTAVLSVSRQAARAARRDLFRIFILDFDCYRASSHLAPRSLGARGRAVPWRSRSRRATRVRPQPHLALTSPGAVREVLSIFVIDVSVTRYGDKA